MQPQIAVDHSPLPPAQKPGPILPLAGTSKVSFAGFVFTAGDPPPEGGLFVLTRRIGEFLYPLLFGHSDNMAAAVEAVFVAEPTLAAGLAEGLFWTIRASARPRAHILRDLVGKYDPPLNIEHRKKPAAPEIEALVGDRATGLPEEAASATEKIEVSEAELAAMVRGFYAEALQDPLIGPVFSQSVVDWEEHFELVQAFWSRTLLGTTRYGGSPFTPHLNLRLKPEFFERWVSLFRGAAQKQLPPAAARAAIAKVEHMSVCFQAGLFPLAGGPTRASSP